MKKFFQLFLFLPRFLAILAAYLLRGKKTLTCTLTTESEMIQIKRKEDTIWKTVK